MASSILNSDDGVVSGSSGLKTTGGDDGSLKIQNNGVDAITISAAGVATFANSPVGVASLSTASGSAPSYSARAWVNFVGNTPGTNPANMTINGQGNVSSVTRLGTGTYQVNFAVDMPNANYVVAITLGQSANGTQVSLFRTSVATGTRVAPTFSNFRFSTFYYDLNGINVAVNPVDVHVTVFN